MKAKTETYKQQKQNGNVKSVRERILNVLPIAGGLTKDDLIKLLKVKHSTITARLSDLHDDGHVKIIRARKTEQGYVSLYVRTFKFENERIREKRKAERIERSIKYLEENGYAVTLRNSINKI